MTTNNNVRTILANADLDLRSLTQRYARVCWEQGWKAGKTDALNNKDNHFCGGPGALIAAGVTEVDGVDGPISITPTTRIRVRMLTDAGFAQIEEVYGKPIAHLDRSGNNAGADVLHQEYVDTFEENVENDYKHFLNNGVSAAAVVNAVFSRFGVLDMSPEDAVELIEGIVSDDADYSSHRAQLNTASRDAWIGRACQDGSWAESGDFVFDDELKKDADKLDIYVVVPVLNFIKSDLENGFPNLD